MGYQRSIVPEQSGDANQGTDLDLAILGIYRRVRCDLDRNTAAILGSDDPGSSVIHSPRQFRDDAANRHWLKAGVVITPRARMSVLPKRGEHSAHE